MDQALDYRTYDPDSLCVLFRRMHLNVPALPPLRLDDSVPHLTQMSAGLMNAAGFPRRFEFSEFDSSEVRYPEGAGVESLKSLEFYRRCENILLYGGTGTGKTMLSICIGMEACRQDIPVRFCRTAALVNLLAEAKNEGTLSRLMKKLNSAEILILDEFGYVCHLILFPGENNRLRESSISRIAKR